ncbi:uncharacterized protein bcl2l12 [Genypterus blacodes]|uniref:uncharacterized protein bcl2l12 n=1 Tax=Genypterus blacodes TaxID=154954 RepID=UPI003F766E32
MADTYGRRSSVCSISLVEIKAETHLVLKAFLHQTLSVPLKERPGRIGGAYKDHNTHSTKPQPRKKDGWDSQAEDVSSADEKKSLKDFIKQLPRRSKAPKPAKDPSSSLEKDIKPHVPNLKEDDALSPSSTSDEDDKKQKKLDKKKIKKRISKFFRRKIEKDREEREGQDSHPHKPAPPLPVYQQGPTVPSPNHPPEFYNEVAERLDKIAQRSTSIKKPKIPKEQGPPVCDKEAMVRELVQVLSLEGDAINTKIQSDPFLRSNLARLSYPSFAKLLDTFGNCHVSERAALPPAESPTLQRVAITMEVSRRIVTATGTQRMQGYAECYMETFAPWVKRHGGWENIVDLEEPSEYD